MFSRLLRIYTAAAADSPPEQTTRSGKRRAPLPSARRKSYGTIMPGTKRATRSLSADAGAACAPFATSVSRRGIALLQLQAGAASLLVHLEGKDNSAPLSCDLPSYDVLLKRPAQLHSAAALPHLLLAVYAGKTCTCYLREKRKEKEWV